MLSNLRKGAYLIIFLFFCSSIYAQSTAYSRIKIDLHQKQIQDVAKLGLDVTHGDYAKGKHFISDFSRQEIENLATNGFDFEILIPDVQAHYILQNTQAHEDITFRDELCFSDESINHPIPDHFELGSMGGYYTYQEMLDILDQMATEYPHLITMKRAVDSITTHDGNPIYWLRLSDNPAIDEDEPEILYTALHHAREPNSLSQMIYYLWYLLERYDTDPEVQYLVDNVEMYFVPCVNPDGYIFNQTINPQGGGLWRKNRRDNENGTFGVDLNRNYGHEWGHDDEGSSPFSDSDVYRGPSAFSEPETQAIQQLCNDHAFQIALNYHSFGNLLIYPWGFSDTLTNDAATFLNFAEAITRENDFFAGTGSETVGYTVNGVSDDWMYGETTEKPPIFSFTPEVGPQNFGFWPPSNAIITLCQSTLLQNLSASHLLLNYGLAQDLSDKAITVLDATISYSLKRYGLADGTLSVGIEPISGNILSVGDIQDHSLEAYEEIEDEINLVLDQNITFGDEIVFLLTVDNGNFIQKDTIKKVFSEEENSVEAFSDAADNIGNWENTFGNTWNITTEDFVSAPSSITDSPETGYAPNTYTVISMNNPINLVDTDKATLKFWAKWNIETGFDYAQVLLSTQAVTDGTWIPLCGLYSVEGNNFQAEGEPLYDAFQADWVEEVIDISEFIGEETIYILFLMAADSYVEEDGFYFDDLSIEIVENGSVATHELNDKDFRINSFPNPANNYITLDLTTLTSFQKAKLSIYNTLGEEIDQQNISLDTEQININTSKLQSGIYFYQVEVDKQVLPAQRVVVLH